MSRTLPAFDRPVVTIRAVFEVECSRCDVIVGVALTCTAADKVRAAHVAKHAGEDAVAAGLAAALASGDAR